jgi:Xaa-Pro aminopeptidase
MAEGTGERGGGRDKGWRLARRLETVRRKLGTLERRPGAVVVTGECNRRYLTGFTGSSGAAVVSATRAVLVTDFRYLTQAKAECPGWEIVRQGPVLLDTVAEVVVGFGEERVGFERDHATFALYEDLSSRLKGFELIPVAGLVDSVREIKEEEEIDAIREAALLTDRALGEILPFIKPGVSEMDIALELEYRMRKLGADGVAFPAIVASGPRSALPHGRASKKRLAPGELVTVDTGAVVGGYCSDLTRTFALGPVMGEQEKVYRLVLEAQLAALEACRPGRAGKEIDQVARDVISARGHGDHFGHGLGHGVGLAVHEGPRLSPTSDQVIEAGHVVTVEPGVYIEGWGGVRIEDLVAVRADGVEILSTFPKELQVL